MFGTILIFLFLNITSMVPAEEWRSDLGMACAESREWAANATTDEINSFKIAACDDIGKMLIPLEIPDSSPNLWYARIGQVPRNVSKKCLEPCESVGFAIPCNMQIVLGRRLGEIRLQALRDITTAVHKLGCDYSWVFTERWQQTVVYRWSEFHTLQILGKMQEMLGNIQNHKLQKNVREDNPTNDSSSAMNTVSEDRPRSILDDYDIRDLASYEEMNQRFVNIFGIGMVVDKVRYDSLTKEIRLAYQKEIEWRIRHMPAVFSENETPELYEEALLRIYPTADLSGVKYYTRMVYGRTAVKALIGLRRGAFLWPTSKDMADKIRHLAEKYGFTLEEIGTDEAELDRLSDESPFKGDTVYRWE